MQQTIVNFRQDAQGDWIADLACGHSQHVRHRPPWELRPWVTTPEGREARRSTSTFCAFCAQSFKLHQADEQPGL